MENDLEENFFAFRDIISKHIKENADIMVTELSRINGEFLALRSIVLDVISNSQDHISFLLKLQIEKQLELGPQAFKIPDLFQEHWLRAMKYWLTLLPKANASEPDPLNALSAPIRPSADNDYIEDLVTDARRFAEYANRDTRRLTSALEAQRFLLAELLRKLPANEGDSLVASAHTWAKEPPTPSEGTTCSGARYSGLELRAFAAELDKIRSLLEERTTSG